MQPAYAQSLNTYLNAWHRSCAMEKGPFVDEQNVYDSQQKFFAS
jgi:hypothetical protein